MITKFSIKLESGEIREFETELEARLFRVHLVKKKVLKELYVEPFYQLRTRFLKVYKKESFNQFREIERADIFEEFNRLEELYKKIKTRVFDKT